MKFNQRFKRFLGIGLIVLFSLESFSQTINMANDINTKYWYYRYKLQNDFMVIGEGSGMSIPASIRNKWGDKMKWAEGTIYLGWYLGVLATENKLLNDFLDSHGLQNNNTEMYYALKAMDRLDNIAETHIFYNGAGFPSRNGFFARDDVKATFLNTHYEALNSSYTRQLDVTVMNSDWMQNNLNHEMSRDQVIHVLMGLKLVWLYAPRDLNGNPIAVNVKRLDGTVVSFNFHSEAKNLAIRIIDRALGGVIRNPVSGAPVSRGGATPDLTWPLNQLKREFNGQSPRSLPVSYQSTNSLHPIDALAYPNFAAWLNAVKHSHYNVDNLHMAVAMGAIAINSLQRYYVKEQS